MEDKLEAKYEKMLEYNKKDEVRKKSSMHVAAFILGLASILSPLFYYICLPTGILAIVFGAKSVKRTGSRLAKAGFILGIIGLVFCLFAYISIIFISLLTEL